MRLPWPVARWLARRLVDGVAKRRPPDVCIGPEAERDSSHRGTGAHDSDYLRRWWLIPRNRFFTVYLHQFLASDDDKALHDHPYHCVSVILRGGYYEHINGRKRWRYESDVVFRRASTPHRIELQEGGFDKLPYPAWSLFIGAPRVREWGFHCATGWVPWTRYHKQGGCS